MAPAFTSIPLGPDDDGRRIDRVAREAFAWLPLGRIYSAIRAGEIRLNGRKVKGEARVSGGDLLEISIYELEKRNEFKTVTVRVEESGDISLPVIGIVNTLDLTVVDIEEKIVKALQDIDFILSPRVSVVIKEYESKKIAVLGSVTAPGWARPSVRLASVSVKNARPWSGQVP